MLAAAAFVIVASVLVEIAYAVLDPPQPRTTAVSVLAALLGIVASMAAGMSSAAATTPRSGADSALPPPTAYVADESSNNVTAIPTTAIAVAP